VLEKELPRRGTTHLVRAEAGTEDGTHTLSDTGVLTTAKAPEMAASLRLNSTNVTADYILEGTVQTGVVR
jgi:hypothetical protein